jgi:hypothetical protein
MMLYLFEIGLYWVYPLAETFSAVIKGEKDPQWISFWLVRGVLSYLEFNVLFFIAS